MNFRKLERKADPKAVAQKLKNAAVFGRKVKLSAEEAKVISQHNASLFVGSWLKITKEYTREGKTYKRNTYQCPICGNEIIQPQNYCGACGARLDKE